MHHARGNVASGNRILAQSNSSSQRFNNLSPVFQPFRWGGEERGGGWGAVAVSAARAPAPGAAPCAPPSPPPDPTAAGLVCTPSWSSVPASFLRPRVPPVASPSGRGGPPPPLEPLTPWGAFEVRPSPARTQGMGAPRGVQKGPFLLPEAVGKTVSCLKYDPVWFDCQSDESVRKGSCVAVPCGSIFYSGCKKRVFRVFFGRQGYFFLLFENHHLCRPHFLHP